MLKNQYFNVLNLGVMGLKKIYISLLAVILALSVVSCTPAAQVVDVSPTTPDVTDGLDNQDNSQPEPSNTPVSTPEPENTPLPTPKPTEKPKKNEPDSSPVSDFPDVEWESIVIPEEFLNLSYYYSAKHERYQRYKALNPDYDFDKAILYVNIGLDKPYYNDIREIKEPDRLDVLVNKYNKLPDNYKPQLEEIPSSLLAPGVGKQYLRKEAKEAFEKMHNDAKKLGLNITVYGTYRSIQTQHDIWNRKVKSGRTVEDVDRLNSRGGHSEHHTGLAVDVIKNDYTMESSKEFEWYKTNAHKYGFIIRYPKGKENITGYSYEPWHLRYLGPELATAVYESGLSYEEYYAIYIEPFI